MGTSLVESLKIHPLWKGFPVQAWQSSLDKLQASEAYRPCCTQDMLPFDFKDFYVLGFDGIQFQWLGDIAEGVDVSLLKSVEDSVKSHDAFETLSLQKARPGVRIVFAKNSKVDRPLALLLRGANENQWNTFSHQVEVQSGAQAEIFLAHQEGEGLLGLCTHRFDFKIRANAHLEVLFSETVAPQRLGHSYFNFTQERDSKLNFVELISGVHLGRNEISADLVGPGAFSSVSGVHLLNGSQTYDSRVSIRHTEGQTVSRQNFRCVVSDQAKSLFGGKIDIVKDAQKVDAAQSHKALLISQQAKAVAFPELEILADDVKAAHGSSIGQMDKDQVFYLKSRGLTEAEALNLLGEAFVRDALMKTDSKVLRQLAEKILQLLLPQFIRGMEAKLGEQA